MKKNSEHKEKTRHGPYWRRISGERIENIRDKVKEHLKFEIEAGNEMSICIGSDSQVRGRIINYAIAICFIRKGKGGFFFVKTEKEPRYHKGDGRNKPVSVKERMLSEVNRSIQTAFSLIDIFEDLNIPFEVHYDINESPAFKSNSAFREAIGYGTAMGFNVKAKPNAFGATYAAGKVC